MTRRVPALILFAACVAPAAADTSPRASAPDVRKFKEVAKYLPPKSIWLVVGGGRHLLSKVGNDVVVYDAATGKEAGTLKGHTGNIHDGGYSRDGRFLVTAGYDSTCKVWDLSTLKEVASIGAHAGYS